MARIRTIKPEFPQSESMGRVSRDARLLFVMLWTICDDAGKARGNSRMLASLLYPYDTDAGKLMDKWMGELERENCITRYEVEGNSYVQIAKWLDHQKIDKPSKSKFPDPASPREDSRDTREPSSEEGKGSEEGNGKDQEGIKARSADADVSAAFEAFNSVAKETGWPLAQAITPKRRAAIKARMAEAGGLDGWLAAMAKARASPFLRGDGGRDKEHAGWAPDLDFFLQQASFTKLTEGKYDQRGRVQSTGFDALREGASRAAALDGKRGEGMEGEADKLHRLAISGSA